MSQTGSLKLDGLEDHRRLTQGVMRELEEVHRASAELGLREVEKRTQELLDRANAQVFRIAVVGEFKRGKSTLINALIGREVLPADVLPCSATLNRITYGLQPSVKLHFGGDEARVETIGIDELEDYVTKLTPESEKRAADIKEAVVHFPLTYCRDKADIIDTPGLNDERAMTDVTLQVLPEVDAAILVILAQSPFSSYEAAFLNRLLTHDLGRVMFVVNRMDEIRRPKDRERVLDVVRQRIKKSVRARAAELHGEGSPEFEALVSRLGEPRVYGVSGALALDGKLENDPKLLEESKFQEFESALERFLTMERGLVSLALLADSTAAAAGTVLQQVHIRRGALQLEKTRFESVFKENAARLEELNRDYQVELRRLDRATKELSDTLRPMSKRLAQALLEGARDVLENYPLDADSISKSNAENTQKRMIAAVQTRLQSIARRESERLNQEIERGLEAEVERLRGFSASLTEALREIEFDFQPPGLEEEDGVAALAGGVAAGAFSVLGGGALAGGISGYRLAGVQGAAVGSVTGAAVGFGTALGLLTMATMIGLPLTWPVTLPALAISGVAAAFGGKAMVQTVFAEKRIERFREQMIEGTVEGLERQAPQRTVELSQAIDEQVSLAFQALRDHVEEELGGSLRSTERTLAELRDERHKSESQRLQDTAALERSEVHLRRIELDCKNLVIQLRELPEA